MNLSHVLLKIELRVDIPKVVEPRVRSTQTARSEDVKLDESSPPSEKPVSRKTYLALGITKGGICTRFSFPFAMLRFTLFSWKAWSPHLED